MLEGSALAGWVREARDLRCTRILDEFYSHYIWRQDGEAFFETALAERVITVPGIFFDINPGKRRADHTSRFRQYLRFSFGPNEAAVTEAVRWLQTMVARFQR